LETNGGRGDGLNLESCATITFMLPDLGTAMRYANLLSFENTLPMPEAHRQGQQLKHPTIYVHFCRRSAIEPLLLGWAKSGYSREGLLRSLDSSTTISGGADRWTLVYLGIAAALESGRTPGKRLNHEFALKGFFRQAPALEALFLVIRSHFEWKTRCGNRQIRRPSKLNIKFEHGHEDFLIWCAENVRCAYHERPDFPRTRLECGTLLRQDERRLITEWKPLLNVDQNRTDNDVCEWLSREREQFRRQHMLH
jgi:hypothetical protein